MSYVDDLVLLDESYLDLQKSTNILSIFLDSFGLIANPAKCHSFVLKAERGRVFHNPCPPLILQGDEIQLNEHEDEVTSEMAKGLKLDGVMRSLGSSRVWLRLGSPLGVGIYSCPESENKNLPLCYSKGEWPPPEMSLMLQRLRVSGAFNKCLSHTQKEQRSDTMSSAGSYSERPNLWVGCAVRSLNC
ncbi:hypothetical protein WMY93_029818 [Mugilogobius chulae]|uniref:Reverse transcriptase domain-containing protein n=1 Tax=Mugilogobius chulae TaxID=88201 RepID=A0AAW0MQ38_9GOBI